MKRGLGLAVGVVAMGSIACTHTDLARNAPGIVDVQTRPESPGYTAPRDPGEQMVTLSYGVLAGAGIADGSGSFRGYYGVGPEISLAYGTRDTSHHEDDWFVGPERAIGVNLGAVPLTSEGHGIGPLYGEIALREGMLASLSPGWAWDVDDKTHGPQVTVGFTVLYLRATHQLGASTSVSVGLVIKGEHGWIWSR